MTILPVGDLGARLSGLQTGRLHGAIIAGVQTLTAAKMGFRQLIDFSKLPIEIPDPVSLFGGPMSAKTPKPPSSFLEAGSKESIY